MPRTGGTLMEVAERCGVSQSTVSRVLNKINSGRFSVSTEVRERIERIAREMNYRPSMAARNLAMAKTRLVAVLGLQGVWSDRAGPIEAAVSALAGAVDRAGYEMYVQFASQRHGTFNLPALRVDGVVAIGAQSLQDLEALEEAQIPYVSLNGVAGKHGSMVAPDDAEGTETALRYLMELGHRKIAYLDHPSVDATHMSVKDRREAFFKASERLGFKWPSLGLPQLAPDTPWEAYHEPFLRGAVMKAGATAVLAYSHHGALALLRLAHDLGLSVPKDFSLICFNDEPIVRLSIPSLTALNVSSREMGEAAAQLLLRQMSSQRRISHLRLPERLIIRESTAPPPAR